MQAQRASLKRTASGAFARQQEVQERATRNSQSPTMATLRAGKHMLVPPQQQPDGLLSSPDMSNGHPHTGRDQYQYPTQADLLRHMPQSLESSGLSNEYRDQGHLYSKEPMRSSPAMQFVPDSQMDMVKYHNNNTLSDLAQVPGYEMQAPAQGYPNQEDDLDQQALRAKKDAETKRKQIPPFVQKLSR